MRNMVHRRWLVLPAAALAAYTSPVIAQEGAGASAADPSVSDIIVTARRVEERLQDVPISITVFNSRQLSQNNITSMKDLGAYTPGLQVNSRFGSDSTNFSIRGFTQEQRTYATVGTYFSDVVAPRGSGATFGGDGAGPGALFDLQNVQVLKGPQGTLQGRNVTGGAVLLVPQKPTDRLEGYVEGSVGDYALRRIQAVVNVPVMDTLRLRFGLDRQTRDGYLINIGRLGDGLSSGKNLGNVNYWAGRVSMVADLAPNLENYTIATYSYSRNNGVIPHMSACFPTVPASSATGNLAFGQLCAQQMAREAAYGPWAVSNRLPDAVSINTQWQIINTTTWRANDLLTVKNIMSYAEFRATNNSSFFGDYFILPGVTPGTETGRQVAGFSFVHADSVSGRTNAQSSFVEELRLEGRSSDSHLVWQGGVYLEMNDPLGFSGSQPVTNGACNDVATFDCSMGSPSITLSKSRFRDYAAYGQASYDITDRLKLTAGLRYTWDRQSTELHAARVSLATLRFSCANPIGTGSPASISFPLTQVQTACAQYLRASSEAPTWTLGLDYKPVDDLLLYVKYSRGYRQGGLAISSPDTTQPFQKETVDNYEVGVKSSWRGRFPGSFNAAAFYNGFRNQQLLLGVISSTGLGSPSAAIVNAGKSRMIGAEAELSLMPFKGLRLTVSYGYLNTKLQQFVQPTFPAGSVYDTTTPPIVGDVIPNAGPDHKVVVQAHYTLPLSDSIGRLSFGGTFSYASGLRSVSDACTVVTPTCPAIGGGLLPSSRTLNLNANWEGVGGMPVDLGFFMTNVTNEVNYLQANDNTSRGFISRLVAEPRMFGFRLKYHFGD